MRAVARFEEAMRGVGGCGGCGREKEVRMCRDQGDVGSNSSDDLTHNQSTIG